MSTIPKQKKPSDFPDAPIKNIAGHMAKIAAEAIYHEFINLYSFFDEKADKEEVENIRE